MNRNSLSKKMIRKIVAENSKLETFLKKEKILTRFVTALKIAGDPDLITLKFTLYSCYPSVIIGGTFYWMDTIEGYEFWEKYQNKAKKEENEK